MNEPLDNDDWVKHIQKWFQSWQNLCVKAFDVNFDESYKTYFKYLLTFHLLRISASTINMGQAETSEPSDEVTMTDAPEIAKDNTQD